MKLLRLKLSCISIYESSLLENTLYIFIYQICLNFVL
jgi:hypothetical protein